MKNILELLPQVYAGQLSELIREEKPDELRLNVGRPVILRFNRHEKFLWPILEQEQLEAVLRAACRQSVYAHTETIRHGYVTIEGGHRIGICGFGVVENGQVRSIQSYSSLVIRVARQVLGCADRLLPQISGSTLLLGPPGCGKTTLLRDLVRQLSDKRKMRISVADERGELSAGVFGLPQLDIGERTDVMINIPKAEAAMMLLRTMNPQCIAVDEITTAEDIWAMDQISYCGVMLLATAHGAGMSDLTTRPLYKNMMALNIFHKVVILKQDKSYSVQEV